MSGVVARPLEQFFEEVLMKKNKQIGLFCGYNWYYFILMEMCIKKPPFWGGSNILHNIFLSWSF